MTLSLAAAVLALVSVLAAWRLTTEALRSADDSDSG